MPQVPTTEVHETSSRSAEASAAAEPTGADAAAKPGAAEVLWGYFLLSYVALLLNTRGFLKQVQYPDVQSDVYAGAVQLVYTALYMVPAVVFVLAVYRILRWTVSEREVLLRRVVFSVAIVGCVVVQYTIFADKIVFGIFGFHLNGFVWNLVFTRGGVESMGGGSGTTLYACLAGVGFLVVQIALLMVVLRFGLLRRVLVRSYRRTPIIIGVCCFLIAAAYAQVGYGLSTFRSYGPTLAVANAFPGFFPTTFTKLATSMGYETQRKPTLAVSKDAYGLRYPLHDIRLDDAVKPPNIVWLVSESLRADMLDPEIMPNVWALSEQAVRFEHHYSGGNGTRMGMFSMFYGLYGPYWFPFLAEHRGPVLVDTLLERDYQMELFTSAMFSYPEFDQTLFSRIPSAQLHEGGMKPAWRQDRRHIDSLLSFIGNRDKSRPFMTFEFFEAPHANYSFSKQAIIREPYAEELNYVSMDLEKEIGLIKNRYINSCRQIDISIGRVIAYLKEHDLLDSTIVIITGDHGEEFMEKGRWGHNSEFTEEQTVVPLVLWVPGEPARVVTRITSHLDLPATIMPRLGVLNPAADYSLGYDLLGTETRKYTVIGAWNKVAYVDDAFKATFPTTAYAMFQQKVTTARDEPVPDTHTFFETEQANIVDVMRGLNAFRK